MWTKLGDEFSDEARDLSDSAFRTHVEAVIWSNRRGLDLMIPKRDLQRFAETGDPLAAVAELIDSGWWQDCDELGWYVGCRFADWQLEARVVEARRESNATRQKRHRLHKIDDHSLCDGKCSVTRYVTRYVTRDETRDPGRVGSGRDGEPLKAGLEEKDVVSVASLRTQACGQCGVVPLMSLVGGLCRKCCYDKRAA